MQLKWKLSGFDEPKYKKIKIWRGANRLGGIQIKWKERGKWLSGNQDVWTSPQNSRAAVFPKRYLTFSAGMQQAMREITTSPNYCLKRHNLLKCHLNVMLQGSNQVTSLALYHLLFYQGLKIKIIQEQGGIYQSINEWPIGYNYLNPQKGISIFVLRIHMRTSTSAQYLISLAFLPMYNIFEAIKSMKFARKIL